MLKKHFPDENILTLRSRCWHPGELIRIKLGGYQKKSWAGSLKKDFVALWTYPLRLFCKLKLHWLFLIVLDNQRMITLINLFFGKKKTTTKNYWSCGGTHCGNLAVVQKWKVHKCIKEEDIKESSLNIFYRNVLCIIHKLVFLHVHISLIYLVGLNMHIIYL